MLGRLSALATIAMMLACGGDPAPLEVKKPKAERGSDEAHAERKRKSAEERRREEQEEADAREREEREERMRKRQEEEAGSDEPAQKRVADRDEADSSDDADEQERRARKERIRKREEEEAREAARIARAEEKKNKREAAREAKLAKAEAEKAKKSKKKKNVEEVDEEDEAPKKSKKSKKNVEEVDDDDEAPKKSKKNIEEVDDDDEDVADDGGAKASPFKKTPKKQTAAQKKAAAKKLAAEKAAEERAAAKQAAADRAAERKAEADAKKRAAADKKAAAKQAAADKAAEKRAAKQAAADKAAEKKAADKAAEKKAAEKKAAEKRAKSKAADEDVADEDAVDEDVADEDAAAEAKAKQVANKRKATAKSDEVDEDEIEVDTASLPPPDPSEESNELDLSATPTRDEEPVAVAPKIYAIDRRPLTLGRGKIDVHGGLVATAVTTQPAMGAATTASAQGLALGATYGLGAKGEVGIDYTLGLHPGDAQGPFMLHGAYVAKQTEKLDIALSVGLAFDFVDSIDPGTTMTTTRTAKALQVGVWARYHLGAKLSAFSGLPALPSSAGNLGAAAPLPPVPYQLSVGLSSLDAIALDLPVGLGYQATPKLYTFGVLDLAHLGMNNTTSAVLFSDFIPLSLGGFYAASKMDVGAVFSDDLKQGADYLRFDVVVRYSIK